MKKFTGTLICLISMLISQMLYAQNTPLSTIYSQVSKMISFPYISEYINDQKNLSRAEAVKLNTEDSTELTKDPANYKPLRAAIFENDLSHLLTWMANSTPNNIIGIAVYDKSGMLLGFSDYQSSGCKNVKGVVKDKDYFQLFPTLLDDKRFENLSRVIPLQAKAHDSGFNFQESTSLKNPAVILTGEGIYDKNNNLLGFILFLIRK